MNTSIEKLAAAIEYPDAVPYGAVEYVFSVDGAEVQAREEGGRLRLRRDLWHEGEGSDVDLVPRLAALASGRILREEATLAWDESTKTLFLWQEVPTAFSATMLRRFFEVFTSSCDWWLERVREESNPPPVFPEMMIIP